MQQQIMDLQTHSLHGPTHQVIFAQHPGVFVAVQLCGLILRLKVSGYISMPWM